jgi:hypothetical protein
VPRRPRSGAGHDVSDVPRRKKRRHRKRPGHHTDELILRTLAGRRHVRELLHLGRRRLRRCEIAREIECQRRLTLGPSETLRELKRKVEALRLDAGQTKMDTPFLR